MWLGVRVRVRGVRVNPNPTYTVAMVKSKQVNKKNLQFKMVEKSTSSMKATSLFFNFVF